MGLMPLEFKDCLTDSPLFRKKLQVHEKELDNTSRAIKGLIKDVNAVFNAAKSLSDAQCSLSRRLNEVTLECIGGTQTDDEIIINESAKELSKIIDLVEEERKRMMENPLKDIINKLECFRKNRIGKAKEGRKKFHKETLKFYQSQERYLNMSTKKDSHALLEADATLEMEQRYFIQASLDYVFLLQEVQERKKFEFVEILLRYMLAWLAFYHQGHEVFEDCTPYMNDLQKRLQKTKEHFDATSQEATLLKDKMIQQVADPGSMDKTYTRQGYLYLMEKKAFGTTWTKHYCQYQKKKRLFTMIPFNQVQHKMASPETIILKSCVRRSTDSIDKRFCFDLTAQTQDKDKPPPQGVYTLQALSDDDCRKWMDAMDGKELFNNVTGTSSGPREVTALDESGINFISKAIAILESKGLEDQGLYRVVGVSSKVSKLLTLGLDPNKSEKLIMDDPSEWEVKTITSAIKQYFRNLPQPLMTYDLHSHFINSAKKEKLLQRVSEIHRHVYQLPKSNFTILKMLVQHLCNVAKKSDKNLMTVSNLGVCFGPTLLRPEEESVAAIMDIKFCNIVVEILIEHFDKIFNSSISLPLESPQGSDSLHQKHNCATSTSSPKSSPTPSSQSPSSTSVPSFTKSSQPVLQTVVTSFTTSEPQTVHFGEPSQQGSGGLSQHGLARSDGTSNLKPQSISDRRGDALQPQHHSQHQTYHTHPNRPSHSSVVPPPPSATLWNHSTSLSSLNSGGAYDMSSSSVGSTNNPQRSRPARPLPPSNGQASRPPPTTGGPSILFINPLSDRGEGVGSSSSSCESLSSRSSRDIPPAPPATSSSCSSPQTSKRLPPPLSSEHRSYSSGSPQHLQHQLQHHPYPPSHHSSHHHLLQHHSHHNQHSQHPQSSLLSNGLSRESGNAGLGCSSATLGTAYPPTYRQHMETRTSLTGSQSSSALPTLASSCVASASSVLTSAVASNGVQSHPPRNRVRTIYACVAENDSELSFEPNQILTNVRPSKEPGWLEGSLNGKSGLIPENYVEFIDDKGSLPTLISQRNTDV